MGKSVTTMLVRRAAVSLVFSHVLAPSSNPDIENYVTVRYKRFDDEFRMLCMYVCMGFMAFVPAMVLRARSQDSLLLQCVRYVSHSHLLGLRAEKIP